MADRTWLLGPVLAATWLAAAPTHAHIQLMSPTQRTASLKSGPCGAPDSTRGTAISTYLPGQTITVVWEETVDHPGHFRIAFDEDGQDIFRNPASFDDVSGGPGVLIDGIPDRSGGGIYSQEITLPDVECDNCTLQVIQVMTDKPPYEVGTNDLYYQCADLVLSADADPDEQPPPVTTDDSHEVNDDTGCGCRNGPGVGSAWLLLALAWATRRRRRG